MDGTNLIDYLREVDRYYEEELKKKDTLFKWAIGDQIISDYFDL